MTNEKYHISIGEELVVRILKEKGINYEREYTFDGLVGLGGGMLRYDFKIDKPDGGFFLLEIDGSQHRLPHCDYAKQLLHDKKKDDYCYSHNIKLYRIPYTEKTCGIIPERIDRFLQKEGYDIGFVEPLKEKEQKKSGKTKAKTTTKTTKKSKKKTSKTKTLNSGIAYYAIKKGKKCNRIVTSWEECKKLVYGYTNAKYKKFNTKKEAELYLAR